MGESTDIFTRSNAEGTEGMESGCRDTSGRHGNGSGARKISLVFGMHVSAHIHTNIHFLMSLGGPLATTDSLSKVIKNRPLQMTQRSYGKIEHDEGGIIEWRRWWWWGDM